MAAGDIDILSGGLHPARQAVKFIGTVDEACLIDVFATARVAANDEAGTFTAWVNIPDIIGDYGIVSCGDTAAIEFITMRITAGKLVGECNDGTVDQWEHTSTNVVITPHKWHHIALVQDATLTAPKLYVDGKAVAQTATLATDNGTWFKDCDLIDNGSIGAAEEAGAAAQIRECKGAISDVKYWPVALTADEVRKDYEGVPPAKINSAITDWWKMYDLTNAVTAGNPIVKGASIKYVSNYNEFCSRFAFEGALVADDVIMVGNNDIAWAFIINAA